MKLDINYMELRNFDWSNFEAGIWNDEPDFIQWMDESTALPCLMVRNKPLGVWRAYVGVEPGHSAYSLDADELRRNNIEIYGELGYTGHGGDDITLIGNDGQTFRLWWIGFGCASECDGRPVQRINRDRIEFRPEAYKTADFVKIQVQVLAGRLDKLDREITQKLGFSTRRTSWSN